MSISKRYMTEENIRAVLEGYRSAEDKPTMEGLAKRLGTTLHNVMYILKRGMIPLEFSLEKKIRQSRCRMGDKHPLWGKNGSLHPNWKGEVSDSKGRTTIKIGDKRHFMARVVFAEALGIAVQDL